VDEELIMRTGTVRAGGAAVAAGAATWSVTWLVAGPPQEGVNEAVQIWGSFAYQLGLVALLVVLDAAWPLSMLGLVAVGIAVLRARRWPGALRWLPLAAGLLIPVDIVTMVLFGPRVEIAVRAAYMTLAYGALGLRLVRWGGPEQPQRSSEQLGTGPTALTASRTAGRPGR
jgi:hypothetical protein